MSGPTVSIRPARSYKAAADILSKRDPVLRRLVAQAGPVRVNPPAETHFAALVRAILYQQLAGAAARAIHGRLIAALGGEVTPERFLSLSSQTRQPSHIGTAAGGNTPGLSPLSPVAVPLWAHPRHRPGRQAAAHRRRDRRGRRRAPHHRLRLPQQGGLTWPPTRRTRPRTPGRSSAASCSAGTSSSTR